MNAQCVRRPTALYRSNMANIDTSSKFPFSVESHCTILV